MSDPRDEILRQIQQTERRADRDLAQASAEARRLLKDARQRAEAILAEGKENIVVSEKQRRSLERGRMEEEARALLEEARGAAERMKERLIPELDALADRLVRMILPDQGGKTP